MIYVNSFDSLDLCVCFFGRNDRAHSFLVVFEKKGVNWASNPCSHAIKKTIIFQKSCNLLNKALVEHEDLLGITVWQSVAHKIIEISNICSTQIQLTNMFITVFRNRVYTISRCLKFLAAKMKYLLFFHRVQSKCLTKLSLSSFRVI